jgi:hypothetical protein
VPVNRRCAACACLALTALSLAGLLTVVDPSATVGNGTVRFSPLVGEFGVAHSVGGAVLAIMLSALLVTRLGSRVSRSGTAVSPA